MKGRNVKRATSPDSKDARASAYDFDLIARRNDPALDPASRNEGMKQYRSWCREMRDEGIIESPMRALRKGTMPERFAIAFKDALTRLGKRVRGTTTLDEGGNASTVRRVAFFPTIFPIQWACWCGQQDIDDGSGAFTARRDAHRAEHKASARKAEKGQAT